jgi:hypothetical protein
VVRDVFGRGVVPAQVVVAVSEVDIGFVEDGGVLEGGLVSNIVRIAHGYAKREGDSGDGSGLKIGEERGFSVRRVDVGKSCNGSTCSPKASPGSAGT